MYPFFPLKLAACTICIAAVGTPLSSSLAASPGVQAEFIYLKAPFPQCHASTLVESESGQLVAAWFGGTREKHKDVGIWVSRREAGTWTAPEEVANGVQYHTKDGVHRHPCWNPVLTKGVKQGTKASPLMLFYKCGPSPSQWWGMLTVSSDGGRTWSKPARLPEGIDGPVKNKPIRLADGTLLCGSSTEFDGWRVHMEWSSDAGQTWHRSGPLNDGKSISAIQPSILNHGDGRLQALGRSRQQRLWQLWSEDGGRSWGEMSLMELPNPNAGTDAVTLSDGRHLLVYNHTKHGRTPLNVAISKDGKQWQAAAVLEEEPGEYSYPAVIQTSDGKVHITYTWRRQRVRHVTLDLSELSLRPIKDGAWPES